MAAAEFPHREEGQEDRGEYSGGEDAEQERCLRGDVEEKRTHAHGNEAPHGHRIDHQNQPEEFALRHLTCAMPTPARMMAAAMMM